MTWQLPNPLALFRDLGKRRGENFDPGSRIPLVAFGVSGLLLYWTANSLLTLDSELVEIGFAEALRRAVISRSFVLVALAAFGYAVFALWLVLWGEERVAGHYRNDLSTLGANCVRLGVVFSAPLLIPGIVFAAFETTLLNVWDFSFLGVVVIIQYIGTWLYLFNGVSVEDWNVENDQVELERLKMEWSDQKMLLRLFLGLLVSILIGQVFGVMKLKFGNVFSDPELTRVQSPLILVNAIQLMFLVLGWWGLVLARCLKRIEEVKLAMKKRAWHIA